MSANQIGKTMEVYVNDMLMKSIRARDHFQHLDEMFSILRKYKMKLNPNKCMFGVSSSKFLGCMVNQRGIEANPDKIRAILEMTSPRSVKDVQRLTGHLAALSRFISKATDRNLPFFKVLRNSKTFECLEECEKAFTELKTYLTNPSLLSKPKREKVLSFYLPISLIA